MRNSGWYIPYWRKPKKKGKAERSNTEEIARGDEQLEVVRQRWIERYRRTTRALATLGLSVGSNRADVQARYDRLRAAGNATRDVEDAYRRLMRVLPPIERRKKKARGANTSGADADGAAPPEAAPPAARAHDAVGAIEVEEVVAAVDIYDAEEDFTPDDTGEESGSEEYEEPLDDDEPDEGDE